MKALLQNDPKASAIFDRFAYVITAMLADAGNELSATGH
jgi:hypothetical protein